jgi:hypothetical protein
MRFYVFKLTHSESRQFQGVVVIFATPIPDTWRQLVNEEHARRVPDLVFPDEATPLVKELESLAPGTPLAEGMHLLWPMFNDASCLSNGHRATFVSRHDLPAMEPGIPSDVSLRTYAEHCYQQAYQRGT